MIDSITSDERIRLLALQPGETAVIWRNIEPPVHSQHVRFDVEEVDDETRYISVCRDSSGCWWAENRDFTPPVQPGETFRLYDRLYDREQLKDVTVSREFTYRSVVPAEDEGRTRWKIEVGR